MLSRPNEGEWVWVEVHVEEFVWAQFRIRTNGGTFTEVGHRSIPAIDVIGWTRSLPQPLRAPDLGEVFM